MKRRSAIALLLAGFAALSYAPQASSETGWVTLFDGKNLDNFNKIGDANWRIEDGAVVADKGNGFLVTKNAYTDFQIRAEFWVEPDSNSGIFIRCTDPEKVGADNAYEVNIWDARPDPSYGTGAIVNVAKVDPMPKAGGKWNVYEITAKGSTSTVVLNGQKTVDGVQNLQVAPAPAGREMFIIKYIEPLSQNLAALGLDLASEPNRRNAAIAAVIVSG
ncbi:CHASE domain protein [mine drainage metagenome]|uniref:CHASE domain protein n=1 Tax=mine drainage metagenome TaxID=410659 RepID=A0A1J5PPR7_9ZZZZ